MTTRSKVSETDMLVTIAVMALMDDDFTAHDVVEVLQALGHGDVVREARKQVAAATKGPRKR